MFDFNTSVAVEYRHLGASGQSFKEGWRGGMVAACVDGYVCAATVKAAVSRRSHMQAFLDEGYGPGKMAAEAS